MKTRLLLLLVSLGCILTAPVFAQTPAGPVGGPAPGGGACDWTAIKDSIQQTESSGNGCNTPGPQTRYGQAAGKYQFIPPTWDSMSASCPNASMCPHASTAFYTDPICCQVQECAMDNLLASNMEAIQNDPACQQLLGQTVNSPRYGSCTASLSGLLAAFHLGGSDACRGVLQDGRGDSDGHTYEADYICRHGGVSVPTDCDPPPNGSGGTQVIGTGYQLDILIGQGDPVFYAPIDPLKNWWVYGLQMMAAQFTTTMVWQVEAIGMLLDAKHQLETQRLFQQKTAEAHRDYQPSEQMCTFGTFSKDLAATQRRADLTKEVLSKKSLQRDVGTHDTVGATPISDSLSRISKFRRLFCNPSDGANGLTNLCPTAAPAATRNADINFTQTIDQKLSLDVDFTNGTTTTEEEVVLALVDNLFTHRPPPRFDEDKLDANNFAGRYHYMNYRSLVAIRGVARSSLDSIIALKSASAGNNGSSAPYLKSLMTEFGLSDAEIETFLGENPSYYAQMELLTKKMYQNPTFYTSLIDKPANIKRMRAAMRAIKLMQDRDIAAAIQRREMLMSMMLELRLREKADQVYTAAEKATFDQ